MSAYRERHNRFQKALADRWPVVETRHGHAEGKTSGARNAAITVVFVALIAFAVLITLITVNSERSNRNQELALEREEAAAREQSSPGAASRPQALRTQAAAPSPEPSQSAAAPSNAALETDVVSRLQRDSDLRSFPIKVKAVAGQVTLSGNLPSNELKAHAERIIGGVKGVRSVVNNVVVQF